MRLEAFGWNEARAAAVPPGLLPARVTAAYGGRLSLVLEGGEAAGVVRGRLRLDARSVDLPTAGDWVGVTLEADLATVEAVLPRTSLFSRKAAGRDEEQAVAANVDVLLVCAAAGRDLNARRIERYVTAAFQSGAEPVVLVTKADTAVDLSAALELAARAAQGVEVIAVSALSGLGLEEVAALATPARTLAFLGSSGVGKSTLVNRLLGADVQPVAEVRAADEKGRHTTTVRELIPLPTGGAVIDTPGMRELGLWDAADGLPRAFPEVDAIAQGCRFGDCTHESEPGCAVLDAVAGGALDADRVASYRKLVRELDARAARSDPLERERRKSYDKSMERALRARLRDKGR